MNRKEYNPELPESISNHELGKWCYIINKHCEDAIRPVNKICLFCLLKARAETTATESLNKDESQN